MPTYLIPLLRSGVVRPCGAVPRFTRAQGLWPSIFQWLGLSRTSRRVPSITSRMPAYNLRPDRLLVGLLRERWEEVGYKPENLVFPFEAAPIAVWVITSVMNNPLL